MFNRPIARGHFAGILFVSLWAFVPLAPAFGKNPIAEPNAAEVYKQARLAAVGILVDDHLNSSGWFADAQGLVFTAAHTIGKPGQRIEVVSRTDGRFDARVVAVDRGHDLALLRVPNRQGGYPALRLAAKMPVEGETVYLFGTPLYRHAIMLQGSVARADLDFEYNSINKSYTEVFFVSGSSPPGTSGGPWLNRRGEVVGMQSMLMTIKDASQGISFVTPVKSIRELLKTKRSATTPTIGSGLEETWQQDHKFLRKYPAGTEGLVTRMLQPKGPAAQGGLKEWDLITKLDGLPVNEPAKFLRAIRAKKPGQKVTLKVLEPGGKTSHQVVVTLGKVEIDWPKPAKPKPKTVQQKKTKS